MADERKELFKQLNQDEPSTEPFLTIHLKNLSKHLTGESEGEGRH